eukprot:2597717-Rhodomonas_salina.7
MKTVLFALERRGKNQNRCGQLPTPFIQTHASPSLLMGFRPHPHPQPAFESRQRCSCQCAFPRRRSLEQLSRRLHAVSSDSRPEREKVSSVYDGRDELRS